MSPSTLTDLRTTDEAKQRARSRQKALREAVAHDLAALAKHDKTLAGARKAMHTLARRGRRNTGILTALLVGVFVAIPCCIAAAGTVPVLTIVASVLILPTLLLSGIILLCGPHSFDHHPTLDDLGRVYERDVRRMLRTYSVKLRQFDQHRITGTLIGGWKGQDGVNVRTDRVHPTLLHTQTLLDEWAVEDFGAD